jgi:GxxExxY protein
MGQPRLSGLIHSPSTPQFSKIIIDAAMEVHREMGGPGLIEDVYEEALCVELRLR